MHTVELLLDDALETGTRALWDRLHAAGLASLARHRHPTNRPHVTLVSAASLTGLPPLPLPLETTLGPVRLLGRALVREVADTPALRRLHLELWQAVGSDHPLYAPDRWTPHVSLALNVPATQQAAACELLADIEPAHGRLVAARTYDTDTRSVTML